MDVSVIIVNYNTLRMTSECIESVFNETLGLDFEVILVDNASTDGSREHFQADGRIKYVYNGENLGFGKANNAGLALACGRNVLFLNSDTLLTGNAVKILSDFLDAHQEAGACGANLLDRQGGGNYSFGRRMPGIGHALNTLLHCLPSRLRYGRDQYFNHTGKPQEVAYITGADLMVKASVLERAGGFNPEFFMYFEETELCWRIKKAGWKIFSVPEASIIHLDGASFRTREQLEARERMVAESRDTYFRLTGKSPRYAKAVKALSSRTARRIFLVK